jgi:hypothetical protein
MDMQHKKNIYDLDFIQEVTFNKRVGLELLYSFCENISIVFFTTSDYKSIGHSVVLSRHIYRQQVNRPRKNI